MIQIDWYELICQWVNCQNVVCFLDWDDLFITSYLYTGRKSKGRWIELVKKKHENQSFPKSRPAKTHESQYTA